VFLLLLLLPLQAATELDRFATVDFYTPDFLVDQQAQQIKSQENKYHTLHQNSAGLLEISDEYKMKPAREFSRSIRSS